MAIPRKSAQFTDEQWHQIELARARMYAYRLRIQPYPLEDGEQPFERTNENTIKASIHAKQKEQPLDKLAQRLDKFQGEMVRLSDMFSKHIKGKQKKTQGSEEYQGIKE